MSRFDQRAGGGPMLSDLDTPGFLRATGISGESSAGAINPSISEFRPKWNEYASPNLRTPEFRWGLMGSILFHACIAFLLLYEASSSRSVLVNEKQNQFGQSSPVVSPMPPQPEIIKAVSVDSQQVQEAVLRLKQARAQEQKAEAARQRELANQAEVARQNRLQEEKRLIELKQEAERVAILRKKQVAEEQAHLKELTLQKEREAQRLATLKKEQALIKEKQAAEEKKRLAEKAQAAQKQQELAKAEKVRAEQARAEQAARAAKDAAKQQEAAAAAARQAQMDAANQARIAGEVDKYKALIIDAIGRQWILPDTVNRSLSSQFRIRLAPDGGVLDVSLIRSSGDPILDRSAQTAIYKASPLPVPNDPMTFNLFRDISLTVRPENIRG